MDFSYLLELAKTNDKVNKEEASVSRFSTKLSRPKKEARPGPKVEAVKAVIDKIVTDKQKENEEARKKKENLLKLRAQDRKSNKRVKAMINMSKGASKSVLEDAKDITTAHGEEQCDEDDYGYESNMSQQIFSKLANRYANLPEDDKLKFVRNNKKGTIDDIKSRVINTLKKEEEDESGPRRRKRKRRSNDEGDDFINDGDEYDGTPLAFSHSSREPKDPSKKVVNVNLTNYKSDKYNNFKYNIDKGSKEDPEKEPKKKAREKSKSKAAPPPMSFEELLRVAQKKHQETPIVPPKEEMVRSKDKDKKKDNDRPLTAKEKEELEEERRRKLRRMGKLPPEKKPSPADAEADKQKKGEKGKGKGSEGSGNNNASSGGSKLKKALEAPQQPEPKVIDRSKYFAVPFSQKPRDTPAAPPTPKPRPAQNARPQGSSRPEPPYRENKPQKPPAPPAKDMRPNKSFKPPLPKGRAGPPPGMHKRPPRPPSPQGKMRIESDDDEEEYDSEMDDFIDDGEDETDISSEIKRMFGYDRNKYKDEDDDLDDMEASFSQMQKEERISAKIGLQEDLEDMKREEEEKRLKMMRLKQAKKARR